METKQRRLTFRLIFGHIANVPEVLESSLVPRRALNKFWRLVTIQNYTTQIKLLGETLNFIAFV